MGKFYIYKKSLYFQQKAEKIVFWSKTIGWIQNDDQTQITSSWV